MLKNNKFYKLFFVGIFILFLFGSIYVVSEVEVLYRFINDSDNLKKDIIESIENFGEYGTPRDWLPNPLELQISQEKKEEREEKNWNKDSLDQPLIQTTGEREEVLGLIHLGLLEVETNKEENIERARQQTIPTITRISMGEYYGSGAIFTIDEDSIILISNQHLIREGKFGQVTFFDGTKAKGEVMGTSDKYDVGFMKVKLSDIPYQVLKELRYVSIDSECYETLKKGDEIFLIGSSDGAAKSIYEGTIGDMWWYFEEFDSYMIYNYCFAKQGMSGGGTFDAHGHYIGMITGGNEVESASLPLITIVEEYKNITGRGLEFSVS